MKVDTLVTVFQKGKSTKLPCMIMTYSHFTAWSALFPATQRMWEFVSQRLMDSGLLFFFFSLLKKATKIKIPARAFLGIRGPA